MQSSSRMPSLPLCEYSSRLDTNKLQVPFVPRKYKQTTKLKVAAFSVCVYVCDKKKSEDSLAD